MEVDIPTGWPLIFIQNHSANSIVIRTVFSPIFLLSVHFCNAHFILRDLNTSQLQGLASSVCVKYCCLSALYLDRGYSPKQFVRLFDLWTADTQVTQMFTSEIPRKEPRGDQCLTCYDKS